MSAEHDSADFFVPYFPAELHKLKQALRDAVMREEALPCENAV
ncbi:hypothetical protein [Ruminococcus callidus]|nr:hypothetical protein [Ruminococcus callidus]